MKKATAAHKMGQLQRREGKKEERKGDIEEWTAANRRLCPRAKQTLDINRRRREGESN